MHFIRQPRQTVTLLAAMAACLLSLAADKADHWAFMPLVKPSVPAVKYEQWIRNPIDAFILARLEKEGLRPSLEADRRTLIRRLTFDLTGLPPTPEEVEAYCYDLSPNAYEKVVDRLLASSRYGERWARHWLDVVHYGESHGYDKDKPRPNAWPYRDYVIRAFNSDKPYSQFVQEQLAGDVLFPNTPDGVIATGFIAAGPWDFVGHVELREGTSDKDLTRANDRDDMVMTTLSTFQSLTVHCARCHNHKFDPITQEDYYRLTACFAGIDRGDRPYDPDQQTAHQRQKLLAERSAIEAQLAAVRAIASKIKSEEITQIDARLVELQSNLRTGQPSPSNGYHSNIESQPNSVKWVQIDLGELKTIDEIRIIPARPTDFPDTPGFGFPVRFRMEIAADEAFSQSKILVDHTAADFPNPGDKPFVIAADKQRARVIRITATRLWERTSDFVLAFAEVEVSSGGKNVARSATVRSLDSIESGRWAQRFLIDGYDSRKALETSSTTLADIEATRTKVRTLEQLRQSRVDAALDEPNRRSLAELPARLTSLNQQIETLAPKNVYAALPLAKPRPVNLLARGDVKRPGKLMHAGALSVFAKGDVDFTSSNPDSEAARRAALANWLTHPANMLTRASIVNRIWHYHFGRGIVETPNDFGHMGASPSHPELLNWLAWQFLENGESIKSLHRVIVTSATYRQSSRFSDRAAKIDADNRFLWRMNRTRLDAECLRDAILQISGKLDLSVGGPSVQQFYFKDDHSPIYDYTRFDIDSPGSFRRGIYRFIVRSVPDPFMETLDCPDASVLTPKRNTTLTALQALSMLNNPFVLKQCEHLAERAKRSAKTRRECIEQIYDLTLSRPPSVEELQLMTDYANKHGLIATCRVLLNSNEFMFVD